MYLCWCKQWWIMKSVWTRSLSVATVNLIIPVAVLLFRIPVGSRCAVKGQKCLVVAKFVVGTVGLGRIILTLDTSTGWRCRFGALRGWFGGRRAGVRWSRRRYVAKRYLQISQTKNQFLTLHAIQPLPRSSKDIFLGCTTFPEQVSQILLKIIQCWVNPK